MWARRSRPGARLEYLCYAPELLTSEFAARLIEEQSARGGALPGGDGGPVC